MSRRLVIRFEAEAEITDAAIWYHNQQVGLGPEFLAEIQAALQKAAEDPRRFPRLRRNPEVRRALVTRFPYRIFFIVRLDKIVVFKLLHATRHDREWKRALPFD